MNGFGNVTKEQIGEHRLRKEKCADFYNANKEDKIVVSHRSHKIKNINKRG